MVPPPNDDGLPILRDYIWREFSMVLYGIVAVTFVFGLAALIEYCSARRNRVRQQATCLCSSRSSLLAQAALKEN